MSGVTINDIPNLPGYRKRLTSTQISLQKTFPNKMIKEQTNNLKEDSFYSEYTDDENSVRSYAQDSIKDANMINFPATVKSYQDISGRYSLKSQKEDRYHNRHHLPFTATNSVPNFIVSEHPQGKICRFIGYFFETNPKNLNEPLRTRKVDILYYLADDTIEIIEPKINNSGAIQGRILKRQRVPRSGSMARQPSTKAIRALSRQKSRSSRLPPLPNPGANEITSSNVSYISKEDFYAGAEVTIYQTKYLIADCDNATKEYFESELQRPFGDPLTDIPVFDYDFCYSDSKPGPVAYGSNFDQDPISGLTTENNSRRSSAMQGFGASSRISTANTTSMYTPESRSFYEYDKKILRFFGVWDNRQQLYGDRIYVQVHYFLADNTFEVIPIRERNSGRDDIGTILKRTKILKPSLDEFNTSSSLSIGSTGSVAEFGSNLSNGSPYHWKDLTIGHRLRIAAVDILLTDADEFTRQFYDSKNCPLPEPINPPSDVDEVLSQTYESDSVSAAAIMNGKRVGYSSLNINGQYKPREGDPYALPPKGSLISEAPFKDGAKLKELQGVILRYTAVIKNPSTTDSNRKFVVLFHCEDDCVEIKEVTSRNSGHIGGHFATRSKIENKFTGRFLAPSDLYLDADININGVVFHIVDSDDMTLHYMENNSKTIWKSCDLQAVMKKILVKKDIFVKLMLFTKGLASAVVDYDSVEKLCHHASLKSIGKQEVCTLCRAIDPTSSKSVKLTKLLKFILDYKYEDWAET
jgi:EF-hand domain-containing protein 1